MAQIMNTFKWTAIIFSIFTLFSFGMCGGHVHLFFFQIIKRARQNYLLDQYKEKQPQAAQILKDVLSAREVR